MFRLYDIVPLVAATLAVVIAMIWDRRRKQPKQRDSQPDD